MQAAEPEQAAGLARAADDLYALLPGEFRAARDERARQARAAGHRELAAAIGGLRRPTVSAWLVNQLVRQAGERIDELLQLGEELREAQSALAGDRMRDLSGRRRELVGALTRSARRLAEHAGQQVSEQAERELGSTLEAALADPAAAGSVRSGRLVSALSYAGLGGIDVSGAVAVPEAPPGPAGRPAGIRRGRGAARGAEARRGTGAGRGAGAGRGTGAGRGAGAGGGQPAGGRSARGGAADAAGVARRDLAEAEAAARDAEAALAEAGEQAEATARQHEAARQRIGELERELGEAQTAEARTARAASEARRRRDSAARALTTAQRRLERARARASQGG